MELQASLIAKRTWYGCGAGLLIVLSGIIATTGLWMLALISFAGGLICVSQCADAHGSLHEVRQRSTKTLVPDFSVLRRPDSGFSPEPPPAPQ